MPGGSAETCHLCADPGCAGRHCLNVADRVIVGVRVEIPRLESSLGPVPDDMDWVARARPRFAPPGAMNEKLPANRGADAVLRGV